MKVTVLTRSLRAYSYAPHGPYACVGYRLSGGLCVSPLWGSLSLCIPLYILSLGVFPPFWGIGASHRAACSVGAFWGVLWGDLGLCSGL